jgi:hypothetical protein
MRSKHFNFALAIVISAAAHVLLWPASKRILVPEGGDYGSGPGSGSGEISLLLNDESKKPPEPEKPKLPEPEKPKLPKPKPPQVVPPDDMGESTGKGTGAQAAKGDTPMKAPQAEQDQAFLSRDPVGVGRVGDPPTVYTGPSGEDGSGGQAGGSITAPNPAHSPSHDDAVAMEQPAPQVSRQTTGDHGAEQPKTGTAATGNQGKPNVQKPEDRPPLESAVHTPEPEIPSVNPPTDVVPPESKKASIGSAVADMKRPAADEVKSGGPLAQVASTADGDLQLPKEVAEPVPPVPASSTAPPSKPDAPIEHSAVVIAPQLPLPAAPLLTPPPPAVEASLPKAKSPDMIKPNVAVAWAAPAPHAPNLITTGNARAPGRQHTSADPAQESDSESDPFSKTASADVLHDGRLEVREGRKVKTTRPHFLPGAQAAFYANPDATLVLKIGIDETGKVTSADIIRSAGSIEIDQPCRVAVYDWWFEPTHNKAGKPVADVVMFTIHFR